MGKQLAERIPTLSIDYCLLNIENSKSHLGDPIGVNHLKSQYSFLSPAFWSSLQLIFEKSC